MKSGRGLIAVCGLITIALFILLQSLISPKQNKSSLSPANEMRDRSRSLVTSLLARLDANGRYIYRYDLKSHQTSDEYGWLRHAGTTYELARFAAKNPSPELTSAISRANSYLLSNAVKQIPNHDHLLALVSDPSFEKFGMEKRALLGGAGLALAAIASAQVVGAGSSAEMQTARGLGEFILFMQKPDGDFYMSFVEGKKSNKYALSFFRGEAILGLVLLSKIDSTAQATKWRAAAVRGLEFIVAERESTTPDNWSVLAIREILNNSRGLPESLRERLLLFTRKVLAADLKIQPVNLATAGSDLAGCSQGPDPVISTAATLEGALAAISLFPRKPGGVSLDIIASTQAAIGCLARHQTSDGIYAGAIRDEDVLRIDASQHSLAAFESYLALGFPVPSSGKIIDMQGQPLKANHLRSFRFATKTFTNWDLGQTYFEASDFSDSTFTNSTFAAATFRECALRKTRFLNSDLRGLRAHTSDLRGASFESSQLAGADFSFSDLRDARFIHSDLSDVTFAGARLEGAIYDPETQLPFSAESAKARGLTLESRP